MTAPALVLEVDTPLGFRAVCSAEYWERIVTMKHPPMRGRIDHVVVTLAEPDEVRRSVNDPAVLLFHRRIEPRYLSVVVRREGTVGYVITAYPADRIKQGDLLWTK